MPLSISKTSKVGHWATVGHDWATAQNGPLLDLISLCHKNAVKVGHDSAREVGIQEDRSHALRSDAE